MNFVFDIGEYAEGRPWKLVSNYEDEDFGYNRTGQCHHRELIGEPFDRLRSDGTLIGQSRIYRLPLVAICENEGGHNSTILCVLCLDEARKANGL